MPKGFEFSSRTRQTFLDEINQHQTVYDLVVVGGQVITTAGAGSTQKAEQVIPSCTVTVYVAGTLTPATIYADRATTPTPKANPFTANSAGEWFFYAAAGRYDVRLSGGSGSNTYPSPVTYGDFWISSPGSSQPGTATRLLNAYNAKLDGGYGAHQKRTRPERFHLDRTSASGGTGHRNGQPAFSRE
jgi:hypothetical protein